MCKGAAFPTSKIWDRYVAERRLIALARGWPRPIWKEWASDQHDHRPDDGDTSARAGRPGQVQELIIPNASSSGAIGGGATRSPFGDFAL